MGQYWGIIIAVLLAAGISAAMVTLSWVLGPKKVTPYKSAPYECGVSPAGDANERFPIKFYLVAILFVLFDIEVVFLWGWMTSFKGGGQDYQIFSFAVLMVYMALWVLGDVYALRVGAIDWDEATSLHPAKLGDTEFDDGELPVSLQPALQGGGGE
ncbi:MAG: NADH-quinone oxidoreductase subunit A [Fimbriimonadaceae bacterium]|nr:NADH-quinone oxidoreductase subunit A [Fimbriimonadaceae bacterium]